MTKGLTDMPTMSSPKPCLHIDFDADAKEVKGVAVGDTVYILIKGVVKGVEQRESWDDPKKMMASMSLKNFDVKVSDSKSDWASEFDEV